jgi:cysteine desulfurase
LPGTLNIAVGDIGDEVDAEAVLAHMPTVAASTGSACSAGAPGPSHVLTAMGLTPARALASLRFGLSRLTARDEVRAALPCIIEAVRAVRDGMPTDPERLVHTS